MKINDEYIVSCLLKGNYIGEEDIKNAKNSSSSGRVSVLDFLINDGLVNKTIIGQAIAESLDVSYADLDLNPVAPKNIFKLPKNIAEKYRVVLFKEENNSLVFCSDNPKDTELEQEIKKLFPNKEIQIAFCLSEYLNNALSLYEKSLDKKIVKIIKEQKQIAPNILAQIFEEAIHLHSSDVHFEPIEENILVRFRIDGVLRDVASIPKEHYENILNRIKVQSGIRIDEHNSALDGAMQFKQNEYVADLRVSIIPTVQGEKVVLRILSSYVEGLVLSQLGLSERDLAILEKNAKKPFGMIMVVGPTGSGKTTTLYALLKLLNKSEVNITTIEDPVEYKMKGVNQIQVNTNTNLTFAKGLRSVVRQDPDIILVGEIRDTETAEIAVNAALTGHLLLSTFHANDAATAIPRILDMGVEPFLLSSTLEVVLAQRLVRKICHHCKESVTLKVEQILEKEQNLKDYFKNHEEYILYQGKGCPVCDYSGYLGRTALFEIIEINPEIEELILKNPSSREIWQVAYKNGAKGVFEDGIEKVKNGVTTLEEVLRVAQIPQK